MAPTSAAAFLPWTRGYLHPFWDGSRFWYGVGEKPRTIVELAMCRLSAELRSHEGWWKDRLDTRIQEEWCRLHVGRVRTVETPSGPKDIALNIEQVKYVIDELAGYSALRDEDNNCQVSCFERVWESNTLLTTEFLSLLDTQLRLIRNINIAKITDSITFDLIDPYAFPLRYNHTLVYSARGQLHHASPPTRPTVDGYTLSTRFADLPTSFSISAADDNLAAHALAYINNVDPSFTALYSHIETVLAQSIPLFEHVLTDLHRDNPLPQRIKGSCKYTEWDEPEEPEHSDDEDGWATYEREMRTWALQRPIAIPDIPATGYPGGLEERRTVVSLRGTTVKVLVKVSDIRLTPERPHFPGTPWQVAGMRNEHVVACAFHCVSSDNITPLNIAFRMPISSPFKFTSGDEGATARTWGLRHGSPGIQSLGQVPLSLGRSVASPNVYQHALQSAGLIDPEKEGSVTIMSLFLVDPDISNIDGNAHRIDANDDFEILTTSNVPPQQKAWIYRALEECLDVRIPHEVVERIMDFVGESLMTDEEACTVANVMKTEREWFRISHARYWFNLPFDVWTGEQHF